jgi:hypothetical protein
VFLTSFAFTEDNFVSQIVRISKALIGSSKKFYLTGETILEAFSKTLVSVAAQPDFETDSFKDGTDISSSFQSFLTACNYVVESSGSENVNHYGLPELREDAMVYSENSLMSVKRRFFLSDTWAMGLAFDLQEGDEVVILAGGYTPFILCPRGEHYTLTAEAYVHCCMEPIGDLEGVELKTYNIFLNVALAPGLDSFSRTNYCEGKEMLWRSTSCARQFPGCLILQRLVLERKNVNKKSGLQYTLPIASEGR